MKDKWEEVAARMMRLGISENDLVEKFILGSGSGGQKINKTSSCVYLKHIASGIEVKFQRKNARKQKNSILKKTVAAPAHGIDLCLLLRK